MGQSIYNFLNNRRWSQQNQEQSQPLQQNPQQPQQQEQVIDEIIDPIRKKIRLNEDQFENIESNIQNRQNSQVGTMKEEFINYKIDFKVKKEILGVLKDHSQISLFQQELERLEVQDIKMIRIYKIDFEIQQIIIEVISTNSKIEEISDLIQHQIIDQLQIKEDNFNLDKMLYFLNQDQQSFQQLYNCYFKKIDSQKFQYVARKKNIEQIEHIFSQVKQQIKRDYWEFNNREWDYLMKNKQDLFQKIMLDNKCYYEICDNNQNLQQPDHQLLIQYDYIQNWQCDGIVDAFNQSVKEKSYKFYDKDYELYCDDRIKNKSNQDLKIYERKDQQQIIFSVGKLLDSNKINKIFEQANQLNIKTLVFPGSLFQDNQIILLDDIRKEATLSKIIKNTIIIDINYNRFDSIVKFTQANNQPAIILPHYSMKNPQLIALKNILNQEQIKAQQQWEKQNSYVQFQIGEIRQKIQFLQVIEINRMNEDKIQNVLSNIKDLIQIETQNLQIPYCNQRDLIKLESFLLNKSIDFEGQQIRSKNKVDIKCFKIKLQKINKKLALFQYTSYPSSWKPQDQNFCKQILQHTQDEFIKISDMLKEDLREMKQKQLQLQQKMKDIEKIERYEDIKIIQISRLQNQYIYENYIHQTNQLLKLSINQHIKLTEKEKNRLLWHGAKYKDPKIIYEGEGFKTNFCRKEKQEDNQSKDNQSQDYIALWCGRGIYFAQNSMVAHKYAHLYEKGEFPGKYVFLLCLVSTGRCLDIIEKIQFKEPPHGYHCVQKDENYFPTFCLYDMDVRRAYPAYEVIYEFE